MHFDKPILCEKARVGRCFSKCRYIIFRKGRDGRTIPYNADGSGGHNCNPPKPLRRDEFPLQVFSYALNGFPIQTRCPGCCKSVLMIPLSRDTTGWSLPFKLRFDKLEWPWEMHASTECKLPLWDGHVSYLKRECLKENLIPKL